MDQDASPRQLSSRLHGKLRGATSCLKRRISIRTDFRGPVGHLVYYLSAPPSGHTERSRMFAQSMLWTVLPVVVVLVIALFMLSKIIIWIQPDKMGVRIKSWSASGRKL